MELMKLQQTTPLIDPLMLEIVEEEKIQFGIKKVNALSISCASLKNANSNDINLYVNLISL